MKLSQVLQLIRAMWNKMLHLLRMLQIIHTHPSEKIFPCEPEVKSLEATEYSDLPTRLGLSSTSFVSWSMYSSVFSTSTLAALLHTRSAKSAFAISCKREKKIYLIYH